MNQKYLNHDYFTDIITFDYCEDNVISGDLFISVDRVKENADSFNVDELTEIHRVMIHGVLHLCGYKDKTEEEEKNMRLLENKYLN
jgi:rRNA maturation RNase YbeY